MNHFIDTYSGCEIYESYEGYCAKKDQYFLVVGDDGKITWDTSDQRSFFKSLCDLKIVIDKSYE